MLRTSALTIALLSFSGLAHAHFAWLERGQDGATQAYFGEWADDLRETQEGPLKILASAKVTQNGKPLEATRHDDHFAFASQGDADVRLEQVFVRNDTRVLFNAKSGRQETQGASPLELVPTQTGGDTFTLLFEGKPLGETEVVVFGPPKWSKTLRTDAKGQVQVPTPWAGQYVIETSHGVEGSGKEGDKPYAKSRYVSTTTFTVNK
ncbi:DUF4198 domain-containing protein [Zestomonas carbonaria]|uniref:DUF4198 domain-containing protein n=1 Tax=Zestomonas carbonaria TaxID=2762745 RepID=A0A7U7EMI6_9GAMM|nr:DUF4198 domain-containing protein [Pseudomonas carbonaria]CAD5107768.1 hypothetical protein PSEWESI4_02045 [Pseudomonas carbonaria]